MISKSICSIVDVERYIEKAGAEDLKAIRDLLDIREKRLSLRQYEEQLNNILNEIRDLGYNIFMNSWFEETFDEIHFGIQADEPMDICIDFSHN